MKKLLVLMVCSFFAIPTYANLIITAVYDGPLPGGLPKGVELYVVSDIADLSSFGIGSANNGGGSNGEEFSFPADAALAGTFIYIASEAAGFTEFFGFAPDYVSSAMSINGDDAIELFENGVVVDLFGDINVDGSGHLWDYLDGWAYRQPSSKASAMFNPADWSFSGINALDGELENQTALNPIPIASYSTVGGGEERTIVINEVDADTEGTDELEFIELYDGGKGNTSLSGLAVVLFNGSNDASYRAFDLEGFSTDENGYFVLGNPGVDNVDFVIGSSNIVQNGADAVALINDTASEYPNGTLVSADNVIDALVYGTGDAADSGLLILLNAGQSQVDESANKGSTVDSNQRCPNGMGGARNSDAYAQASPTPGRENECSVAAELRLISEVQGTPATQGSNSFGDVDVSPLIGRRVVLEAVVVGDFQNDDGDTRRNLGGFYLQEEVQDEDGNPESSEGIFILDNDFGIDVELGDLVRLTGTVGQYFGETQINQLEALEVLASGQLAQVAPATISLLNQSAVTLSQDGFYQPDLEAYEGMLIAVVDSLQIAEQFQLDRFNEIKLVAGERPIQFSQNNTPDPILYDASLQALGARRITYDDGLNVQNAAVDNLDGFGSYGELSAKRMGDTISNLSGVLDYKWAGNSTSGATWRVRSHSDGLNLFTSTLDGNSPNPRPALPEQIAGNLKIASFNVLNFFTTLDEPGVQTAAGHDPRGADSAEEFDRQLEKTVNALLAIDADIVGLVEIENDFDGTNDGSTAIEVLVNSLNQELGDAIYDYVYPGQRFVGSDAIAVAFIYKSNNVTLATDSAVALLDDTVAATLPIFSTRDFASDPIFNGIATNRVALAATFTHGASGDSVTLVANHFKSKGASDLTDTASPNFDQLDGAGYWNQRRLDAAMAIDAWLDTYPTSIEDEDVVILGDLNAYAMEAPVQYLLSNGFNSVEDDDAYSYVFDGQVGTLDYLLVSDSLWQKFTEAAVWHINADEADALDYNLDFGRDAGYFDATTATRNSDHDPVVAGFDLAYLPTTPGDLMAAFSAEVDRGALRGVGFIPVLRHIRLGLFYDLLAKADYFMDKNKTAVACLSLKKAAKFSDGRNKPGDWIEGSGLIGFNAMIAQAMEDASCR